MIFNDNIIISRTKSDGGKKNKGPVKYNIK